MAENKNATEVAAVPYPGDSNELIPAEEVEKSTLENADVLDYGSVDAETGVVTIINGDSHFTAELVSVQVAKLLVKCKILVVEPKTAFNIAISSRMLSHELINALKINEMRISDTIHDEHIRQIIRINITQAVKHAAIRNWVFEYSQSIEPYFRSIWGASGDSTHKQKWISNSSAWNDELCVFISHINLYYEKQYRDGHMTISETSVDFASFREEIKVRLFRTFALNGFSFKQWPPIHRYVYISNTFDVIRSYIARSDIYKQYKHADNSILIEMFPYCRAHMVMIENQIESISMVAAVKEISSDYVMDQFYSCEFPKGCLKYYKILMNLGRISKEAGNDLRQNARYKAEIGIGRGLGLIQPE